MHFEIYDMPVAYFPYFFINSDPSLKEEQSGFLFPKFK